MRIWIDIDNPPQARYLSPFVPAFRGRGHDVFVTARDSSITHDLLAQQGIDYRPVGKRFGGSLPAKILGGLRRARALERALREVGGADVLITGSRPGAIAARRSETPALVLIDYEHVELQSYRRAGAYVLFPDVIDPEVFLAKGFQPARLIPFSGLKEDLTLAGVNLDQTRSSPRAGDDPDGLKHVLIRPPAEDSHYFTADSAKLLKQLYVRLAPIKTIRVVFSPRENRQVEQLVRHEWANEPQVLRGPVPALALFASVDWVVCGGGTMLREAAYLGVPALSILAGPIGAVDAYLHSTGAVRIVRTIGELCEIDWMKPPRGGEVAQNPGLLDELMAEIEKVSAAGHPRG
jgi:predicted glycosyltransferase